MDLESFFPRHLSPEIEIERIASKDHLRPAPDRDGVVFVLREINSVIRHGKADRPVGSGARAGIIEENPSLKNNRCGIEGVPFVPGTGRTDIDDGRRVKIPCDSVKFFAGDGCDPDPVVAAALSPEIQVICVAIQEQVGICRL